MNPQAKQLLETIKARQEKMDEEKKNIDEEIKQVKKMVEEEKSLTYEDIARELFGMGFYSIGLSGIVNTMHGGVVTEPHNAPTRQQLESILALNKLCNVAKYLNDGWLPDWGNIMQKKYYLIYHYHINKIMIDVNKSISKPTVYFKSMELAEQAIKILGEEEIKKALTLNH